MTSLKTPRVYRTEAVVLKGYDYGEADRILTLYTPQRGKVRAIAKGVRRTKSKMSGHLDLFTRTNLLVAHGRQLDIVTQAEAMESFRTMRTNLERLSYGHYVAELVDAFSAEQLPNYPLYALTVTAYRRLASSPNLDLVMRSFEIQLLGFTGYRPQLHRCVNCDSTIEPRVNRFSPKLGGVLCPDCGAADTAAPAISVAALKALRNLQVNEASMLQIAELPADVRREVEQRMHEYIAYRMESRPKSSAFIERLRSENAAL